LAVKEMIGIIQIKKYRTMKQRYGSGDIDIHDAMEKLESTGSETENECRCWWTINVFASLRGHHSVRDRLRNLRKREKIYEWLCFGTWSSKKSAFILGTDQTIAWYSANDQLQIPHHL
jgi:hypothetical protein